MGFSFYTLYSEGSWYDTLGAKGFFFLLFAAKIERRSRNRDEREKNSLVTIAAFPLNFRRKKQGKKTSGTQGTSTSAK